MEWKQLQGLGVKLSNLKAPHFRVKINEMKTPPVNPAHFLPIPSKSRKFPTPNSAIYVQTKLNPIQPAFWG